MLKGLSDDWASSSGLTSALHFPALMFAIASSVADLIVASFFAAMRR
jgi:hypothetical protein